MKKKSLRSQPEFMPTDQNCANVNTIKEITLVITIETHATKKK